MKETFRKIIAEFDKRIETQLKVMAGLGDEIYRYGYGKSLEAYQQGKLIVEIAADEFNNGWIPCSERLPEEPEELPTEDEFIEEMILDGKFKEYIVTIYGAKVTTTLYYFGNGNWYDVISSECYKVIAWQPLPETYKE